MAAIESAYLIKNKTAYNSLDLSEQQPIDCSSSFGNSGCNGGWMGNVFDYVIKNGLNIEATYPYTATVAACKSNNGPYKISSYYSNSDGNCSTLSNLLQNRPITVAVSAGNTYWQNYKQGILNLCSTGVNHGVFLVGMFQNSTMNYWKIKNSWGTSWG